MEGGLFWGEGKELWGGEKMEKDRLGRPVLLNLSVRQGYAVSSAYKP